MADPLREALAALAEQWEQPLTVRDLRALLAAHPEPAPGPTEPPAPEGAVRVRIAVAVDADGEWSAFGHTDYHGANALAEARRDVGSPVRLSWVEAWVPRPEPVRVVEGRVEPEGAE